MPGGSVGVAAGVVVDECLLPCRSARRRAFCRAYARDRCAKMYAARCFNAATRKERARQQGRVGGGGSAVVRVRVQSRWGEKVVPL